MCSAISLWHSSRYKTLILIICALLYLSVPSRGSCDPAGRTRQVARCAPVHSAGSQLPLRVLEMYQIVAAGDDSTPLRSEIKL